MHAPGSTPATRVPLIRTCSAGAAAHPARAIRHPCPRPPRDEARRPAIIRVQTEALRRLRLHGLIVRVDGTHRYHVTDHGLRIALFFTRTYARILCPGLAHVLPRAPTPGSPLRRASEALETAMDRWCADAKLAV
jgi:hypothetical protein